MFIQTQDTPNPQTMKFIPGVVVMPLGTATFTKSVKSDVESNLATMLLDIQGVESVFFAENFITVTKSNELDWDVLKPLILTGMIDYFLTGSPVVSIPNGDIKSKQLDSVDTEIVKQIKSIIETRVQPAVAQDGGSIIFRDFRDGIVYVELQGACSGCPSSTITLKSGIENMLKHYVPEVISVEAV